MAQDIPAHRLKSFAQSIAYRFSDSENPLLTQQAIAKEQKIFAELLKQKTVIDAAVVSLQHALNSLLPANHHIEQDMLRVSVEGIFANRARDAIQFSSIIFTPDFLALVRSLNKNPTQAKPTLTAEKQQEIIDRLVQSHDMRGAEPPIHVLASAIGHRITHEALQSMFAPHGKLYHALHAALQKSLPDYTESQCARIVQGWLAARKDAAIAVTDTVKQDGAALTTAMAQSSALLQAKNNTAPQSTNSQTATIAATAPVVLTPAMIEASKTREQRGEDIAYTINHALACTATDFIDPYVGNLTQKAFRKRISIDAIEKAYDKKNGRSDAHEESKGHGLAWWVGEAAGDFGAIPVTIAFQRLFPGFMHSIRTLMEPSLSYVFKHGAEKGAERYAKSHGFALDDPKVLAKQAEIYKYEVDHLPQAFMWTTSSFAINLATQKYIMKNDAPLWILALGKGLGATISATALVTIRGLIPDVARQSDSWLSRHIISPTTTFLARSVGVDEKTVNKIIEKDTATKPVDLWQTRVKPKDSALAQPVISL